MSASIKWHVPESKYLEMGNESRSDLIAALERLFGSPPWTIWARSSEVLRGLEAAFPCLMPVVEALGENARVVVDVEY